MSPFQLFRLGYDLSAFCLEAQTVINLRILGLSGAIPSDPGELQRMFTEKPAAFAEAYYRAAEATVGGKPIEAILDAARKPLHSKVRANRKRLMK